MNFVKSVLIYSKYSQHCKKLLDIIQNSNVDFSELQTLCIDNEKIRNRIKSNKLLEISCVPCLLNLYQNGTVEKFETTDCFNWFNTYIKENSENKTEIPKQEVLREREMPKQEREMPKQEVLKETDIQKTERPKMKKIESTNIEDIPFEESNDRHKNIPQPKRIRDGDAGYIDDEQLFSGEQSELREVSIAIKKQKSTISQDPHGTSAKAKQLAQAREEIENSINPISQRPNDIRRT